MAKNGNEINTDEKLELELLKKAFELQRIGNRAVIKAQEENRKHNIPNWYSINGVIISDQDISKNRDNNE